MQLTLHLQMLYKYVIMAIERESTLTNNIRPIMCGAFFFCFNNQLINKIKSNKIKITIIKVNMTSKYLSMLKNII